MGPPENVVLSEIYPPGWWQPCVTQDVNSIQIQRWTERTTYLGAGQQGCMFSVRLFADHQLAFDYKDFLLNYQDEM